MGFEIVQLPKITPKFIFSHEAGGVLKQTLNPGEYTQRPKGTLRYQDITDRYGDDPTKRVELWETLTGTATSAEIFTACANIRAWMEIQLRGEGAAKLSVLAQPYQPEERETWPYQRAEALAWQSDSTVSTPFCDIIAAGRGIPREYFIPKVLENSTLFSQASAAILGAQQKLIDAAYAETDFALFISIAWP